MASLKAKPGKPERKSALWCYSHIYNCVVSLKKLMPTLTGVSHSKITKSQVYCPIILGYNHNIISILQSLKKFTLNSQRNESHLVCVMVVNDFLGSGCKQLCWIWAISRAVQIHTISEIKAPVALLCPTYTNKWSLKKVSWIIVKSILYQSQIG